MSALTINDLSPRERQVVPFLTLGIKTAAHRLDLSERTVRMHRKNIMKKAGVQNTNSAIAMLAGAGVTFELARN